MDYRTDSLEAHGTRAMFHGIAVTHLRSADGARAVVSDHGAHVLSWCPANGSEALYLSNTARYGCSDAIRGGVPVIFPQFGERGSGQRHGNARRALWQYLGAHTQGENALAQWQLSGRLTAPSAAQEGHYLLIYEVCLGAGHLSLTLRIHNAGTVPWTCHAALHTYLRVQHLPAVTVAGLHKAVYVDQACNDAQVQQTPALLVFDGEVDRLYGSAPPSLVLADGQRRVSVTQQGFEDTVLWNPGARQGGALSDLPTHGYRDFVCMEAAAVLTPLVLAPQAVWQGTQSLGVSVGHHI